MPASAAASPATVPILSSVGMMSFDSIVMADTHKCNGHDREKHEEKRKAKRNDTVQPSAT